MGVKCCWMVLTIVHSLTLTVYEKLMLVYILPTYIWEYTLKYDTRISNIYLVPTLFSRI